MPAIVFSAVSFFLVSFFSLLVFSPFITWSACWHFLHIGKRDRQIDFVGNGFFGCGVLPASVSYYRQVFWRGCLASKVSSLAPKAVFSSVGFFCQSCGLTSRAPDVWESARFRSIFLASSFSCSQAESTPAHTQVTQTVGQIHS